MATPALRAVKSGDSGNTLTVICEASVARVFENNRYIDHIVRTPRDYSLWKLLSEVRAHQPDTVMDFMSNPRTALTVALSGARTRVGIGYALRRFAYTNVVKVQEPSRPEYSAVHKLRLAQSLGCSSTAALDFALTSVDEEFATICRQRFDSHKKRVVAFFVNSRREHKRWPLKHFAEVIKQVSLREDLLPVVLQTPGDAERVAELAHFEEKAPIVIALESLGQLGAVLKRCDILVGGDGGPKHIAVAVGTKTLTLFGSDPYEYWTPPNDPSHQVIVSPHGIARNVNTLSLITAEMVMAKLTKMLEP